MQGTVTKSMGLWYLVEGADGESYNCRLKGKFKLENKKISNPVAVGDKVTLLEDEGNAEAWIISEILPRENYIIRTSPKKKGHGHIIASNIDLAIVIATVANPRTSLGFIDRFLVTAEAFRIPAMILCNKIDLLSAEELAGLKEKMKEYEVLGYQTGFISALNPKDIAALKEILHNQTTLISGHSGVGKSTVVNQLIPEAEQKTSEISDFSEKGTHTTTFAERFKVAENSYIIDTPGIKELGLAEIEKDELSHYFPELRQLLGQCKFNNCTHTHEPGCAIAAAYEAGEISQSRYDSYLSMLMGDDNRR
ncbi:ribosome small subunit-dependent GTPase A [Reichenbachiella carrageenanivorans]|uniref:Small ribosomal subunit biogenesis GTPase RsgA n=1 Tax=Reichenbachiella carrageenanivorans TaxID=2979869 RepID=A0ABY6D1K0_9BACT|nr:ribosome small subunit-dependent GTPase A [Reichenbachiella carrageenanivorans]UXX80042.1 ribosome small subunit-dependent GTPase A [Reichenbachiella carrageenanivorans]